MIAQDRAYTTPMWGRDGNTLYYLSTTGELIAARVQTGASFGVIDRTVLFTSSYELQAGSPEYDVHPSGEHFVMVRSRTSGGQLVVVSNATR